MNYTSLEQSKKLIELGLKPETADLYYIQYMDEDGCYYGGNVWVAETAEEKLEIAHYKIPCWSVGALLSLISEYELIHPTPDGEWEISVGTTYCLGTEGNETLTDLLVNMVTWLLENGYIK